MSGGESVRPISDGDVRVSGGTVLHLSSSPVGPETPEREAGLSGRSTQLFSSGLTL